MMERMGGGQPMPLDVIAKLLAGVIGGAGFGFVLGRSRVCSSERCGAKAPMVLSIIAGAMLGAAVAWHWIGN